MARPKGSRHLPDEVMWAIVCGRTQALRRWRRLLGVSESTAREVAVAPKGDMHRSGSWKPPIDNKKSVSRLASCGSLCVLGLSDR